MRHGAAVRGAKLACSASASSCSEEYSALAANLDLLREFGFECEEFGGGSLILRAIPADLESGDAIPTLEELAEKLVTAHRGSGHFMPHKI